MFVIVARQIAMQIFILIVTQKILGSIGCNFGLANWKFLEIDFCCKINMLKFPFSGK